MLNVSESEGKATTKTAMETVGFAQELSISLALKN